VQIYRYLFELVAEWSRTRKAQIHCLAPKAPSDKTAAMRRCSRPSVVAHTDVQPKIPPKSAFKHPGFSVIRYDFPFTINGAKMTLPSNSAHSRKVVERVILPAGVTAPTRAGMERFPSAANVLDDDAADYVNQ